MDCKSLGYILYNITIYLKIGIFFLFGLNNSLIVDY